MRSRGSTKRVTREDAASKGIILLLGSQCSCVLKTKAGLSWAGVPGLGKNAGKYHSSPHSPPQKSICPLDFAAQDACSLCSAAQLALLRLHY